MRRVRGAQVDLVQRRAIIRAALGIGAYATAFGAAFGAVSSASGLSPVMTQVLSLVMFSGASQFAFVGVVGGGGSAWAALGPALLLALRNGFYGVALAEVLAARGPDRAGRLRHALTAHLVIDETTAMAVGQRGRDARRLAFWTTGLILFAGWQLGTAAGAVVGAAVDPAVLGLDAAAPAVFLALLWPSLRAARARWVALGGAALALALIPLVPAGVPVLAAAAVAFVGGLVGPVARPDQPTAEQP